MLRVRRLPHGRDLPLPQRASTGSSGYDLRAAVDADFVLAPRQRAAVSTGLTLEIPEGWEGQVRPRSGLALRQGIVLPNSPGTIDADYRGELKVILLNLGEEDFVIQRGARIAQLVLARVETVRWEEVEEVTASQRGDGGFGSTGLD